MSFDRRGQTSYNAKDSFPKTTDRLIVLTFFIGLHFIPLEKHQPIPYLLSFFAAGALYIKHARSIPKKPAQMILLFLAVAFLCTVVAPRSNYIGARMSSFIYLTFSLTASFVIYLELRRWPQCLLARWAMFAVLILLIGSVLEVLNTPIKYLSDVYRFWNFKFPYSEDERDLLYHGLIRPKFFTAEPSHLGKIYAFFLISWLFTSTNRFRVVIFIILTGFGIFLIRSPTLIISMAAVVALVLFGSIKGPLRRFSLAARGIVLSPVVFAALIVFAAILLKSIGPRIILIATGQDASMNVRIFGTLVAAKNLIAYSPLTGVGVGGAEGFVDDVLVPVFSEYAPGIIKKVIEANAVENLIQNFPSNFFISFGIVGGIVQAFILVKLKLYTYNGSMLAFWSIFTLFALTTGALNGLFIWTTFMLLPCVSSGFSQYKNHGARPKIISRVVYDL